MPSVRVWILAVALGSFATGMVVGFAIPEMMAADRTAESPTELYARNLIDRYELSAEQARQLRMVLLEDERLEAEIFRNADWTQMPPELNRKRLLNKRRTEKRIRFVLNEEQRAIYDRESRPENK